MIVRRERGQLVVTTQPDHAFFSGQLLALWRSGGFEQHPRRREILFAAREHDNGWREADSAPRVDPATQRPHTFQTIPRSVRLEIWRAGVERFSQAQPYAALLIAHHAAQLHREHRGQGEWQEGLFEFLEEATVDLLDRSEATPEEVHSDYGFLEVTDLISLAVCSGWEGTFARASHSFSVAGGTVQLEPFPLAGATSFEVSSRLIPDRVYSSGVDLAVTLASAHWFRQRIRVEPASR